MAVTFAESPVIIPSDGTALLASSASVSISNPRRGLKALGIAGFADQIADGPMVGSISASFYAVDNLSTLRALFGAGGGEAVQFFDVLVGTTKCEKAVMNSLSISIEPYTPVTCEVNLSFYKAYDTVTNTEVPEYPDDGVIHGGKSNVNAGSIAWGTDLVSCTYTINQSINPIYLLGQMEPTGYSIEDTTIEVALAGIGLGSILDFADLCPTEVVGTITLGGACDGSAALPFSGHVINPDITIEPNQEIKGSLTVFDTF